jgi:hypothetical protein
MRLAKMADFKKAVLDVRCFVNSKSLCTGNGSQKTILEPFWLCVLCCVFFFASCGIEDYVYLVPVEHVTSIGSTSARITIPNNSGDPNFRYYAIFYRIYISDQSIDSITTSEQRYTINRALASHYNTINPYTVNDKISPSSTGTIFTSLKYYPLYVQIGSANISMAQILQHSSSAYMAPLTPGSTVDIIFANAGPYLLVNYSSGSTSPNLPLRRSADGFTASPNRSFFNSTGADSLTNEININENNNADVEKNPNMSPASSRYAYVSLYIAAAGMDSNFSAVFSRPKHIGVFRLPSS